MAKLIKKEEPVLLWDDSQDSPGQGKSKRQNKAAKQAAEVVPEETLLRVRLEKKGRGGKTVTVVYELPSNADYFKKLTKTLKSQCGSGGTFKGDSIEIQGDRRDAVVGALESLGFNVKISGG